MQEGFFKSSLLQVKKAPPTMPQCRSCGLMNTCKSPKIPVYGRGRRGVFIFGEAPGADEDEHNEPFVGKTGRLLRKTIHNLGYDLERDCWSSNALICRPPDNAKPTPDQVRYCRPNVTNALAKYKPKVVITLGEVATESVIGGVWKEGVDAITRWVGWNIPCQHPNVWICPNFHPSYVSRQDNQVLERFFAKYLKDAFKHTDYPWDEVPDYQKMVMRVSDSNKAAALINRLHNSKPKSIAFDYETNMLKPDSKKAKILSCSVSDGIFTMAYPWTQLTADATRALLVSDIPKIASNLKFEDRWTRKFLHTRVKNWQWDTMLAAHALDSRRGITSIKFQSFVLLGAPNYDDAVAPYIKAKKDGGNEPNRLEEEVDLDQLLLYNAMDSLLEWKVAQIQMEELS